MPALGCTTWRGICWPNARGGATPEFPFVALLVSGGHTNWCGLMRSVSTASWANPLDDAAGEAFDKAAKMLGLPYPGGPHIAGWPAGARRALHLPRPMVNRPGLDFSFSGLKTHPQHGGSAATGR